MPIATIIALIEALVQFAPEIPALVQSIGTIKTLIGENRAPTVEEQAAIDAGLAAAHAALQAAAAPRPNRRPASRPKSRDVAPPRLDHRPPPPPAAAARAGVAPHDG